MSTSGDGESRAPARPRRRVLIVEDDIDTAETTAVMLRAWGHEVWVAYDGPMALEAADAFKPHVVLLDIGLPRIHGYEVARRLRQQPWAHRVVIIAITGWSGEGDLRRSAVGVDHRLLKPVSPAALYKLIA